MRTGQERPSRTPAAVVAATIVVAAAMMVAHGGEVFWVCVPAALIAGARAQSRLGTALATAAVLAGAVLPSLVLAGVRPLPGMPLAVLIPAASVAILVATRERLTRQREALRITASSDPLTGLANRRSLLERVDYEIARHTRGGRSFGLLMLDLDGFKLLNDRFGHAAGDDLLREVGAALMRAMRDQDTVARIGGDEFCVLAPETDQAGTERLAARAMASVGRVTAGIDALGASAGAAVFPDDGVSIDALLDGADQRLLEVKRRRRRGRSHRRAA